MASQYVYGEVLMLLLLPIELLCLQTSATANHGQQVAAKAAATTIGETAAPASTSRGTRRHHRRVTRRHQLRHMHRLYLHTTHRERPSWRQERQDCSTGSIQVRLLPCKPHQKELRPQLEIKGHQPKPGRRCRQWRRRRWQSAGRTSLTKDLQPQRL